MNKLIINEHNLNNLEINKVNTKVRAILVKNNDILIANYGGVLMLPGGKIDKFETNKEALIRELKEETGIIYNDLKELFELEYYQYQYPTREDEVINRLIKTKFYYGDFKGIDKVSRQMTEKEKKDNFELKLIDIDKIFEILPTQEDNPRSEFFNRELIEAIKEYKKVRR